MGLAFDGGFLVCMQVTMYNYWKFCIIVDLAICYSEGHPVDVWTPKSKETKEIFSMDGMMEKPTKNCLNYWVNKFIFFQLFFTVAKSIRKHYANNHPSFICELFFVYLNLLNQRDSRPLWYVYSILNRYRDTLKIFFMDTVGGRGHSFTRSIYICLFTPNTSYYLKRGDRHTRRWCLLYF